MSDFTRIRQRNDRLTFNQTDLTFLRRTTLSAIFWNLNEARRYDELQVWALWQLVREFEESLSITNEKLHEVQTIVDGLLLRLA